MTISSVTNRMDYVGNGATASYSFTFKIFAKTDLKVTKRDTANVETTLAVDTDFTVSGVGDTTGGSITLTAGNLPTSYLLTIRRIRALTQGTDIRNQGDFFPEIHEDAFDDLVMKDQSQQVEIDRAMKLSETTTGVSSVLPIPSSLKIFRWNSAGNAIEAVSPADISTLVTGIDASLTLTGQILSVTSPTLVAVAGGTADVITATISLSFSVLTNGLRVSIEAGAANATTTPTFKLNSFAAMTIVKGNNLPLSPGDIPGADSWIELVCDLSLNKWVLINPVYAIQVSDGVVTTAKLAALGVTTAKIADLNVTTAKIADNAVTDAKVAVGAIVQFAKFQTGALATGSTQIPTDDTIPQNTEGDEYMTLAFTPKSATNILNIEVLWNGATSGNGIVSIALFQDTTANAIAATMRVGGISNQCAQNVLVHTMIAATTSSITFKVRAGSDGTGTTRFNGGGAARLFGGVMASSIVIKEIKA